MKVPIKKTAIVRNVLVMLGCALLATAAYFEFCHWYNFGHLVPYGLHVDALNRDAYIAIPGQTKIYWPALSNFSLVPVRLPACRLVSDTLNPPLEYAYALQKFDPRSKGWRTFENTTRFQFCTALDTKESLMTSTYLLPGASIEVMGGSAIGAMDVLRKDDVVRWVVFREVSPSANWNTAILSPPFRIEDDVQRNEDGSFRSQH